MNGSRLLRATLMLAVSFPFALDRMADAAYAQSQDLGSIAVSGGAKPAPRKKVKQTRAPRAAAQREAAQTAAPTVLPLSSNAAIGSRAPAGSAPALAPTQGSLNSNNPVSYVSDKAIKDIASEGGDYNEVAKLTPGFVSSQPNGVGDSWSGWRGYHDGQFNLTFDGIPVGDANDFTHHSAVYYPKAFLGSVTVDRSPGQAAQTGYATFGGTLGLNSLALADNFGGYVRASYGNFNTFTTDAVMQSGWNKDKDTRAVVAFSHNSSDGVLMNGDISTWQGMLKVEKQLGEVKITALASGGTSRYNNVGAITYGQWQAYGKNYGALNNDPKTQNYVGYNNSLKASDTEYVRAEWDLGGFKFDNKIYTMSYHYPRNQLNGNKVNLWPEVAGGVPGASSDVKGYRKENNVRSFGDTLDITKDISGTQMDGKLRMGVWIEHDENKRMQEYKDMTTGLTYTQMGQPTTTAFKLSMLGRIDTVQPYIEYEWKALNNLFITPGYKYVSFIRNQDAIVNPTTLKPLNATSTYNANLPYLSARYLLNDHMSLFATASRGFLGPNMNYFYVNDPSKNLVDPETTVNYQIGSVYKTEDWTLQANLYQITASNFPGSGTSGSDTYYFNAGKARYQGVEGEVTYKVINNLALYTSGALSSAKYIEGPYTGMAPGYAPKYTFATGLIYDDQNYFGSIIHRITGDYYGTSSQDQVASSASVNGALLKVGSYNSTDVVAGIRTDVLKKAGFGESAEFKIGVNNLFDHRSITDIAGTPGLLITDNQTNGNALTYVFQPSRTYYISAKINF